MTAISEELSDAYDKVKEWPEKRMPGVDITTLGEGFVDLLRLRNLIPATLAELQSLRSGNGGEVTDAMVERGARELAATDLGYGDPPGVIKSVVDARWTEYAPTARGVLKAALDIKP